ncbi:MAG: response regulator [Proteobacteria bacterium]|nr:response regulator [Pseudomonadota bacterium]
MKSLYVCIEDYQGQGEHILVVDDEKTQREIISVLLTKLGYSVKTVSNGEAAVEYLKKNSVDLMVLDMIMEPGMNGCETYKQAIQINPAQKAVIASGYTSTDDVENAQKLGAGQYIKKPYTLEKIGLAVRDELRKKGL